MDIEGKAPLGGMCGPIAHRSRVRKPKRIDLREAALAFIMNYIPPLNHKGLIVPVLAWPVLVNIRVNASSVAKLAVAAALLLCLSPK
jgi:hypothetical protein